MSRSEAARVVLLDAAERLFAEHGIADVSDRGIAEAAGQKNHSAVRYHFGGREGLLSALVDRQAEAVLTERRRLMAESDSLLGDLRAFVLPTTGILRSLPAPSWRARFLARAFHHPDTAHLFRSGSHQTDTALEIGRALLARLPHLSPGIAMGRLSLMVRIVVTSCADVEATEERDGIQAPWGAVGDFLVDALAGMLQAPSSQSSSYPEVDWRSTEWSEERSSRTAG